MSRHAPVKSGPTIIFWGSSLAYTVSDPLAIINEVFNGLFFLYE
ncbi:MAG TPA: hypothetical protein VK616_05525 [Flavitalea sp.]|nr:hypothetical protein [Flavitalea sp.]